jgi:hypothetical protein
MANDDIHIGFDMDGVLVDHTEWKIILARRFGYRLTAAQTASDQMRAHVADEHRGEIQRMLYQDDTYALAASLTPGARELLTSLRNAGIRCTLISRRRDHDLARLLLEKHHLRPDFFDDTNTHFVSSVQDKADACTRLGVTHYIDDEAGVLSALTSVTHRFLMDPYGVAPDAPWTRVSTLAEFRDPILEP